MSQTKPDYETDEGYCTEYRERQDLMAEVDDDDFRFAFVCPRCDHENPLRGDPLAFKSKPFRCVDCNWVSLLVGDAIEEFAASL